MVLISTCTMTFFVLFRSLKTVACWPDCACLVVRESLLGFVSFFKVGVFVSFVGCRSARGSSRIYFINPHGDTFGLPPLTGCCCLSLRISGVWSTSLFNWRRLTRAASHHETVGATLLKPTRRLRKLALPRLCGLELKILDKSARCLMSWLCVPKDF